MGCPTKFSVKSEIAHRVLEEIASASGGELHMAASGDYRGWSIRWDVPHGDQAELVVNILADDHATVVLSISDGTERYLLTFFGRASAQHQH
jgi:hypothetical protein